jgi:hypothetical protein
MSADSRARETWWSGSSGTIGGPTGVCSGATRAMSWPSCVRTSCALAAMARAVSAPVDVDQLAALRALRRGFCDVQVLKVVDLASHNAGRDPAAAGAGVQGHLLEGVVPPQT